MLPRWLAEVVKVVQLLYINGSLAVLVGAELAMGLSMYGTI